MNIVAEFIKLKSYGYFLYVMMVLMVILKFRGTYGMLIDEKNRISRNGLKIIQQSKSNGGWGGYLYEKYVGHGLKIAEFG